MMRSLGALPLPVAILVVALVCPTELSIYAGSLRLPPHRLALIVFLVPALMRLAAGNGARIAAYDYLFLLYNLWTVVVFTIHLGLADGVEFAGALALESFGGYVVARAYVRDYETFRATLRFLLLAMVAVALLAIPESVFGKLFVHDLMQSLTGYDHPRGIEERMGLTRAYATFDHPILYGTFCSCLFAMAWFTAGGTGDRLQRGGAVAFATLLGVSSAPLLCIAVQLGMIGYERLTRHMRGRTELLLLGVVVIYVVFEVISNRPAIEAIVTRVTLDPWTAYYRIQIWTAGLENLTDEPWLGLGLSDWERPAWMASASVDAFWLLVPMRAGLPALLLLLGAITVLVAAVHRRGVKTRGREVQDAAIGWTIAILALGLTGLTVHYWNSIHAYGFFLLGLGGFLADPIRGAALGLASARVGGRRLPLGYGPRPVPAGRA